MYSMDFGGTGTQATYSASLIRQDGALEEVVTLCKDDGLTLLAAREAAHKMVREYESTRDDGDDANVYAIVSKPDDYMRGHCEVHDGAGIVTVY